MRSCIGVPLSILLLAGFSASCAPERAPKAAIIVSAADNGRSVTLPQGSALLVRLPSNGTTGYTWTATQVPAHLRLGAIRYEVPPESGSGPAIAGQGGLQELQFQAHESGKGELTLVYRPAWSEDTAPEDIFRLRTRVVGN